MEDREELKAQRLQLEREREELKLLERTLKEREESIKREREVVLNEVELMLKLKEALRLEKEELNEMEVLKKEREMLLREKEELKKEREELEEGKVELKKQMEAFRIEKIRFWKEDCENQKKESEEDEDALGVDIREKSLQSIPVYTRRPKRVLKPSVYKCSPFISISAVQTTPSNAANDEKQREFPTSPIPLQAMIDPLRVISQDELHELESWANANKESPEFRWFKTIWEKNAWVDSVAIDKYVDFLERRHRSFPLLYTKDCKFCPTYFLPCIGMQMSTLRIYRDVGSDDSRLLFKGLEKLSPISIVKPHEGQKAMWQHEEAYVPVNHANSHWYLMVIHPRDREIIILDSLYSRALNRYRQHIDLIKEALPILFYATGDRATLEGNAWTVREDTSIPKQTNGYDCGIFVMKYIDILCSNHILTGRDLRPFTSSFRESIAYDCLSELKI
ncbi:ubiquitin-like-specific protease ESD4 [Magnolia sinica]|uniref:ubiquitin-like-specific protease ESD4 n=1 Tax=Magnolia sinica TaxID=86752 RepID=UPI00265827DD|nr:ubiquitin-like-specific protease ESD4 [Magnolia sinica]